MKNVTPEQFEAYKTKATWYPLTLNFPNVAEKIGFYGAEIGDGVSIVQFWNSDFCTASFHIKDVEIVKCGDVYTIAPIGAEGLTIDPVQVPVMETVASPEPIEKSSTDDLMAARFAAIEAADADDTFRIRTPVDPPEEEPTSILDEVKKEANKASIFDEPKPTAAPIVTKGRDKQPVESPKPMTRKVVQPVEQPQRPPKQQQTERRVSRPAQPAPKPNIDFGDW